MDGKQLRRLREKRGLTQAQVAAYLNAFRFDDEALIPHQQVSQWENGDRPVPAKPRPLPGGDYRPRHTDEPSISEQLDELFGLSDAEIHHWIAQGLERDSSSS